MAFVGTDYASRVGTFWKWPRRVSILDYPSTQLQEPFITRSGTPYLLWNDNEPDKNLHYATKITDEVWQYVGEVSGTNTSEWVEGSPSISDAGKFYYTSNVDEPYLIQSGDWSAGTVTNKALPNGLEPDTPLMIMDAEVSPDGLSLVYSQNDLPPPLTVGELRISDWSGTAWIEDAADRFSTVNAEGGVNYAPTWLDDRLEVFFSRIVGGTTFEMRRTARANTSSDFGASQLCTIVKGQMEGPCLTGDGQRIYWHQRRDASTPWTLFTAVRV